jgi:hypothetical protein
MLKKVRNIDVYTKQDIPENLHYKNNVRIGDLIVVTKIGYALYISNQSVNWTLNSKLYYKLFLMNSLLVRHHFDIQNLS